MSPRMHLSCFVGGVEGAGSVEIENGQGHTFTLGPGVSACAAGACGCLT